MSEDRTKEPAQRLPSKEPSSPEIVTANEKTQGRSLCGRDASEKLVVRMEAPEPWPDPPPKEQGGGGQSVKE